jgi:hypothetical protein
MKPSKFQLQGHPMLKKNFTKFCMNYNVYCSPSIIRIIKSRRMSWPGHVARMGEKRNVYGIMLGKPKGKRPLGRPRHMWEDNIEMNLREIGWGGIDWTDLAQDSDQWRDLVNKVMNHRVP